MNSGPGTSDWRRTWADRLTTAAEAVRRIRAGDRVFVGTAAGEPGHLIRTLVEHADDLVDVEILQFHTLLDGAYTAPRYADRIRLNSLFVSEGVREAVAECRADYTPLFLSQAPRLFRVKKIPIDVALVTVTPPDDHGYVSLGVSVDITRAAVESATLVIAQVNPRMPRTFGAALIRVSSIDLLVEHEEELPTLPEVVPSAVHEQIAAHLARLVPDGATIQVGTGRIQNAAIRCLAGKRELGIHTELFSDGLMDLVLAGAVTGSRKTLDPGKIVASLAIGTRKLYDFLDGNPAVEFRPSDYVNDPLNIARQASMVSINSGLEVDLTGQVCADSIGHHFYSGMGGHADFTRGAAMAEGGKPVVALPSTAETADGPVSRIVPALREGAGVLTTRGDTHYVVTEYGIAYLSGKSIRERVLALIAVAHPDFRPELLAEAKARRLVYPDQVGSPRGTVYPADLERTVTLAGGESVLLRPVRPTDDEPMKDLFYSFSEQTRYLRFHSVTKGMPHSRRQRFFNVDYAAEMALAVVGTEGERENFLAVGRYMMDEGTNSAEVAFVVRDDWQGRGLGTILFNELVRIARTRGIRTFTAEVLVENHAMLRVFRRGGFPMKTERDAGEIHVELDLSGMEDARPGG